MYPNILKLSSKHRFGHFDTYSTRRAHTSQRLGQFEFFTVYTPWKRNFTVQPTHPRSTQTVYKQGFLDVETQNSHTRILYILFVIPTSSTSSKYVVSPRKPRHVVFLYSVLITYSILWTFRTCLHTVTARIWTNSVITPENTPNDIILDTTRHTIVFKVNLQTPLCVDPDSELKERLYCWNYCSTNVQFLNWFRCKNT